MIGAKLLRLLFVGLVIFCIWFNTTTILTWNGYTALIEYTTNASQWSEPARIKASETREPAEVEENNIILHDDIDWSDMIFTREGWDQDPIVIESHKLLFFTVPKTACTVFKKLFRRMVGYSNWNVPWYEQDPHNPSKNGLKYLGSYSREEQIKMITSPEWTRAIFVRDPLERALSGYMDKGLRPPDWKNSVEGGYIKELCCGMKRNSKRIKNDAGFCERAPLYPYKLPLNSTNFPFEVFVNNVLKSCDDPHWGKLHKRLKKENNWKLINFVGKFENRKADTHSLLKHIGAFEEFGASGWGKFGNESIFDDNVAHHQTGANKKMDLYYTPSLRRRVFELYREDYEMELFKFTIPPDMETP